MTFFETFARHSSKGITLAVFGLGGFFNPAAAQADIKVLATIKPVHALVAQVMGTTGAPGLLVGGTASPHTFVIKPSDMKKLVSADVVFRVSETVEAFTIKAAAALPSSVTLVTLAEAPGVVTLSQRTGGPFEPDDDHDDDHGGIDGHIWLDPANAKAMIDQIAVILAAKSPLLGATYRANAAAAKAGIDRLTGDLERQLAPAVGRPYVVFHDAYQYFEKRFGLDVVGSITVNPDIPPSGKRLSQLRQKIIKLRAACVFGEPNFEAKVIASVIEGTGARRGTLDPEGASLTAGPALYETLMRKLAADVRECLERPT